MELMNFFINTTVPFMRNPGWFSCTGSGIAMRPLILQEILAFCCYRSRLQAYQTRITGSDFILKSEPVILIDTPVKHKLRFKFSFTCLKSGAIKQNSRWLVGTSRQNRILRLFGNSNSIKVLWISKYGMHVASHTRV